MQQLAEDIMKNNIRHLTHREYACKKGEYTDENRYSRNKRYTVNAFWTLRIFRSIRGEPGGKKDTHTGGCEGSALSTGTSAGADADIKKNALCQE